MPADECGDAVNLNKRWTGLAATVAVAAIIGTAGAVGANEAGGPRRTVRLTAQQQNTALVTTEPTCIPAGQCLAYSQSQVTYTGELSGSASNRFALWAQLEEGRPVRTSLNGILLFTGTVAGCGTGTFAFRSAGDFTSTPPYINRLEVIDGTGTGDLEGITGRGETSLDGTPPSGTVTWRFRCRPH